MRSMMSRLNPGPQDIPGSRRTKVGFMTGSVFDSLTVSVSYKTYGVSCNIYTRLQNQRVKAGSLIMFDQIDQINFCLTQKLDAPI